MSAETLYSHFTDLTHTPRMWGRQSAFTGNIVCTRNTPTHVGKTSSASRYPHQVKKHPHARGEDPAEATIRVWERETPPRTWGRRGRYPLRQSGGGNTPTHVGKTDSVLVRGESIRKHPHARGEDKAFSKRLRASRETPPRTWGRPCIATWRRHIARKHPHARGEDRARSPLLCGHAIETPPRTWGRLGEKATFSEEDRNTPTHVGKTGDMYDF